MLEVTDISVKSAAGFRGPKVTTGHVLIERERWCDLFFSEVLAGSVSECLYGSATIYTVFPSSTLK